MATVADVNDLIVEAVCPAGTITVSYFVALIREVIPDDELDNVEVILEAALSRAAALKRFDALIFEQNVRLNDELDERIFDVLVSHPRIRELYIFSSVDAESLPLLLSRALPQMTKMSRVSWTAMGMSTLQANRIFQVFQQGVPAKRLNIHLHLSDNCDGVFSALTSFIRETTELKTLSLCNDDGFTGLAAQSFHSFCQAVGDCPSPLFFLLCMTNGILQPEASTTAAESLVQAIVKKSHMGSIMLKQNEPRALTMDQISKVFMRQQAVQDFDMSFLVGTKATTSENDRACTHMMNIYRTDYPFSSRLLPWKSLLTQDIPLSLWPLILERANGWKRKSSPGWSQQTSHSLLDAVFFLVKEKSDVLLQNVHRRRIRKRKLFQFDT